VSRPRWRPVGCRRGPPFPVWRSVLGVRVLVGGSTARVGAGPTYPTYRSPPSCRRSCQAAAVGLPMAGSGRR